VSRYDLVDKIDETSCCDRLFGQVIVTGYLYMFGAWLMHLFMVQVFYRLLVQVDYRFYGTCCYRLFGAGRLVQVYSSISHSDSVTVFGNIGIPTEDEHLQ
jgi:hypothetical protein